MSERGLVHVIDDEDSIRRSLDFLLSNEGYRVLTWAEPDAFLKQVNTCDTGCVLLDVRMPRMDGLTVQQNMHDAGISLPVIVLTGHGDVQMAVRALQAGAADFLEKPVDRESLLSAIANAFAFQSDREARRNNAEWADTQVNRLTEREREVLDGLACGYPNKTIAYDLGISARTVEVYRANVMMKMQAKTLSVLVQMVTVARLT